MPQARKTQIAIESTPYYHCTSRGVPKTLRGAGSSSSLSVDGMWAAVRTMNTVRLD